MRWCLAALILTVGIARGGDVWVDGKIGNDSHAGTRESPVATIEAGIGKLTPGAVLHVLPGDRPWPGDIRITVGGTKEKPVVIDGHGSLVSGRSELALEHWKKEGKGIYSRPLPNNAWGMQHHWEGGFPLAWFDGEPAENVSTREALRPGCFFLYKNQAELKTDPWHNTLFICLPEGGATTIETIAGEGGIFVGGDYVTVRNFVVEYGGRDGYATHRNRGVVFENIEARYFMDQGMSHHGAEVMVRNAHFHSNAGAGIVDVYPEVRVRYENCLIENDTWRGGVEFHSGEFEMIDCVIRGNPKNTLTVTKGAKVRLENCLLEGTGPTGIRVNGGSQLALKKCTVRGFPTALYLTIDSGTRFSSTNSLFMENRAHFRIDEVHRIGGAEFFPEDGIHLQGNGFSSGEWNYTVKRESTSGWEVESRTATRIPDPALPGFLRDDEAKLLTGEAVREDSGTGWSGKPGSAGTDFETKRPRN